MKFMTSFFKRWIDDVEAVAATEAALVFPILMTLLLATTDMGYGILAAQKTIRASQVTADLVTRHRSVSTDEIDEAIEGGQLSLVPFRTNQRYAVDIVSIEFDDDGDPTILWRETRGMTANTTVLDSLDGLGAPGEGLLAVTVIYQYQPIFSGFVVNEMTFQEVSFARGRLSSTVPME